MAIPAREGLEAPKMGNARNILTPGYCAARRLDRNYSKLIERVKARVRHNRLEYAWLFWVSPIVEHGLAFVVGAVSGILGLTLVPPAILLMCPIAGGLDLYLWGKAYGRAAKGVGYRAPLLLNLDMVYWCVIGYAVGWALL